MEKERAIRFGPEVIYQGLLFDEPWLGKPDFRRRVDEPSDLGAWSYEVVDTNWREARRQPRAAFSRVMGSVKVQLGWKGQPGEHP